MEANEETEESCTWRYAILKSVVKGTDDYIYEVCEEYKDPSLHTYGIRPGADSPEELRDVLIMMLGDIQAAIGHDNILESDGKEEEHYE